MATKTEITKVKKDPIALVQRIHSTLTTGVLKSNVVCGMATGWPTTWQKGSARQPGVH